MKFLKFMFLCVVLYMFVGCATRGEISRFKVQLDYIEASNAALQRDVRRVDSLFVAQQKLIRTMKAEQAMNLTQLEQDMQVIIGLLNDSGTQVYKLDEEIENLRREIIKPEYIGTDSLDTTTIETSFNVTQLYDAAYLDQKRGDYTYAIEGYQQFIAEIGDQDSEIVDDAYYGKATSLLSLERHEEANSVFQELIDMFPDSERVPAAMFKKGIIHKTLGKNDLAEIVFNKIIVEFPHTPEADLSKAKLKELQGN